MKTYPAVSLDELPIWSPWPARLIGLEAFACENRTRMKVAQEYGREKWRHALDMFEQSGRTLNAEQLRRAFYPSHARAAIIDGRLVAVHGSDIMERYDRLLLDWIKPTVTDGRTIVELGAGFGQILWMLREHMPWGTYRGGECTDAAVRLAARLYADHDNISVERMDFYDQRYGVLDRLAGPLVVFTSQAIEQIPDCGHVINVLARYREKISAVFHIEPAYDLQSMNTLLGQMRRRYIEINDYNRNLFGILQSRDDVRIVRLEQDAIGWNPFNALSIVQWEFA